MRCYSCNKKIVDGKTHLALEPEEELVYIMCDKCYKKYEKFYHHSVIRGVIRGDTIK